MTELDIAISTIDMQKAMDQNPTIQLEVKCVALVRMLMEKDLRIAELEALLEAADQ